MTAMPYTRGQDSIIMPAVFLHCLHYILWPSSSAQVTQANLCHGSVLISGRLTYHLCEDGSQWSQQEINGPYTGKKELDTDGTVKSYTQDFILTSATVPMYRYDQIGVRIQLPCAFYSFYWLRKCVPWERTEESILFYLCLASHLGIFVSSTCPWIQGREPGHSHTLCMGYSLWYRQTSTE